MTRLIAYITVLTCCAAILSGCSTNIATGRSQLNLLSKSQEIAIGVEATPTLIDEYGGETSNVEVNDYVAQIGRSLVAHTEGDAAELPWEFFLLDSEVVNAFALPGGKVFVSRGLAEQLGSEAELAGVIGHEIGHVLARHGNERISQGLLVQFGIIAAGVGASRSDEEIVQYGVPLVVAVGGQGYMLKFGRDQELEADRLGLRYMSRAGYDPWALIDVMEVLHQASAGGAPPEFLSTHPHPDTRMTKIRNLLRDEHTKSPGGPALERFANRYERELILPLSGSK